MLRPKSFDGTDLRSNPKMSLYLVVTVLSLFSYVKGGRKIVVVKLANIHILFQGRLIGDPVPPCTQIRKLQICLTLDIL